MKCDELKDYDIMDIEAIDDERIKASSNGTVVPATRVYIKAEVDAAITELKAENERLSNALDKERSETIKYMDELCNAKNEIERLTIDKRNVELRADVADSTIEKLKKKMDDYHLMSDIRRAKIKELKRALWIARAYIMDLLNRDFQRLAYQCNNDDYKINLLRRRNRYYELSEKCLKKAEEYK